LGFNQLNVFYLVYLIKSKAKKIELRNKYKNERQLRRYESLYYYESRQHEWQWQVLNKEKIRIPLETVINGNLV
jgi:hypothetical protein